MRVDWGRIYGRWLHRKENLLWGLGGLRCLKNLLLSRCGLIVVLSKAERIKIILFRLLFLLDCVKCKYIHLLGKERITFGTSIWFRIEEIIKVELVTWLLFDRFVFLFFLEGELEVLLFGFRSILRLFNLLGRTAMGSVVLRQFFTGLKAIIGCQVAEPMVEPTCQGSFLLMSLLLFLLLDLLLTCFFVGLGHPLLLNLSLFPNLCLFCLC